MHFPPVLLAIVFAAVVIALTALARRLPIPSPILQVLAGIGLGFVPGMEVPELEPDIVFFVFLPPILWAAAFFTSLRDFKANRRPIGLLAVGLVLATTAAVAITAKLLIPDLPWAVAVALGAIVSPPDAVAAAAIVSRLPVPHRVIVVLEGESLVNDASALVIYRTAVAAAVTGAFSWGESIVRFFIDAGAGVFVGLVVGWLILRLLKWTRDPLAETLLTLTGPYVAWVAAETIHVSAVLACVAGGLYTRQHFSTAVSPFSRVQAKAVWDLFVFLLNALIFLILGLQFTSLLEQVPPDMLGSVVLSAAAVSAAVLVVRWIWVPVATLLPRVLSAELRRKDPLPHWKPIFLVSWTAMRGIVTLASALALPRTLSDGTPFPYRTEVILIAMGVILSTLLLQGFSLGPIIKAFRFEPEHTHHEEARLARRESLRRAMEALEDMEHEAWADPVEVARLRGELTEKLQRHQRQAGGSDASHRLRLGVMEAERRMLLRLRNEGAISDEVMREIETELDYEAMRLGAGDQRTTSR